MTPTHWVPRWQYEKVRRIGWISGWLILALWVAVMTLTVQVVSMRNTCCTCNMDKEKQ